MMVACSFETSGSTYEATQGNIAEDCNPQLYRCNKHKTCKLEFVSFECPTPWIPPSLPYKGYDSFRTAT